MRGPYTVRASVSGVATQAYFALTNTAGGPSSIAIVSGTGQSAPIETAFAPLQVRVLDASLNPVSGAIVTFVANTPAGSGANGTFPNGSVSGVPCNQMGSQRLQRLWQTAI